MAYKTFEKDPNATLDYTLDWSAWLDGDTISTSAWNASPTGATLPQDDNDATTTTVWVADGVVGTKYNLTNHITTAGGRANDRTIAVLIKEQ